MKAASEGSLKGVLGYTTEQRCLNRFPWQSLRRQRLMPERALRLDRYLCESDRLV